jgi:RNA polymerase sigma-70 factor, ECF subfamily
MLNRVLNRGMGFASVALGRQVTSTVDDRPLDERVERLDAWMRAYGSDVINFAYSYVKDYHVAQDIAQDVFLKAFAKGESFRGQSSVRTWLLSITANRCKDYLRSWSYRRVSHGEDEVITLTPSTASTEQEVIERLSRDELWMLVGKLPLKYREVIVLFYQRELSGHEIAEVLGTSEESVRTRLHRGRTLLRRMLEDGVVNERAER